MSRRRFSDPPLPKKINIRTSIVEQVDIQLLDPLSQEPAYGAWSRLVEVLLNKWLSGEIIVEHFPLKGLDITDLLEQPNVERPSD